MRDEHKLYLNGYKYKGQEDRTILLDNSNRGVEEEAVEFIAEDTNQNDKRTLIVESGSDQKTTQCSGLCCSIDGVKVSVSEDSSKTYTFRVIEGDEQVALKKFIFENKYIYD